MTTPRPATGRTAAPEESQTRAAATESAGTVNPEPQKPQKFKVRQHPNFSARAHPDVLFEGNEKQARRFIQQNFPRGGEVFLEGGGKKQTFNADDHDELDNWRDFQEEED